MTTQYKARVIKRYSNRKLYDTSTSKYTTLGEIATLIKGGEEVVVVDNKTVRDITRKTLSEVFHQQVLSGDSSVDETTLLELIRTAPATTETAGFLSESGTATEEAAT